MKAIKLLTMLVVSAHLSGCSGQSSSYTEEDVRKFVVPGTARAAIVQRFGSPVFVHKNPKFEDGSTNIDEILFFNLPSPHPLRNESWVFSGFQVRLKDGKAITWSASHRDTRVGP